MKPAHGNNGNCEPEDGDKYAARNGGTPETSRLHTSGVTATEDVASTSSTVVNARRVRATSTSSCTMTNVTPISCRTSTARNDRHRSSGAAGRSANRSTGKCSAYPSTTNNANRRVLRKNAGDSQPCDV